MLQFQELPDQEITNTPFLVLSTHRSRWESIPPKSPLSVTLLLTLQSAMVMSFWGQITCIKLASMYLYHLKNIFLQKKKGLLQCSRRDVIGSHISTFGSRFQNPIDCGNFNYCHRVLVHSVLMHFSQLDMVLG